MNTALLAANALVLLTFVHTPFGEIKSTNYWSLKLKVPSIAKNEPWGEVLFTSCLSISFLRLSG
jgi:hypothetical protein